MNRFIPLWLCFLFLACVSVSAQELKVDKVTLLETDNEAETNPRYDGNDEICALLKVYVNGLSGLKFASSYVIDGGNITYKEGYYAVYVANGIRNMMLKHSDYLPVTINFKKDFQTSIKGGKTYRVDISTIGMVKKTTQTIAFNMLPREGSLLINGEKHSVSEGMLQLELGQSLGYYYFDPDVIDLGHVYECSLTANIRAQVRKRDRIRDIDVIRDVAAIRDIGAGLNTDGDWSVELQMSLSDDGVTWSEWSTFVAAKQQFRACKFRLKLYTASEYTTPLVSIAQVTVDMPDRYETGEDVKITDANSGVTIQYENAFRNNPAVNITLQDAAIDDKIEYSVKNNNGFTIKVFNGTLNSYVTRSFDYLAAGYGKALRD